MDLLELLHGDRRLAGVFAPDNHVRCWLATEAALARAQGELGVIPAEAAAAIAGACERPGLIDTEALWDGARNVGYPILGLVRQIDAALAEPGHVHFGATTQDIMDTGLALQLREAAAILDDHLRTLGDALAAIVGEHRDTVMAGRTHGLHAVPTTLGAKFAVFLHQFARHRTRLRRDAADACRVSLHGAGGTSAAYGPEAAAVRTRVAALLSLADAPIAWHVARDAVTRFAQAAAAAAADCARLAREVIDLSRTEIAEVTEPAGHHRGASSTMPQKANPITSEAVIGFAVAATSAAAGLYRAMEAGHERAAGEWQVEWTLLPAAITNAGNALRQAGVLATELVVDSERMRRNLNADGGLIMAEAAMMRLAPELGREAAHDRVYALARTARRTGTPLSELVAGTLDPSGYLGQTSQQCDAALAEWRNL